ncbi:N-acetylmuramoyl-L-alanine amidase [Bacillus sp. V3B]|nr:N-acetylmuramoyl-L-alanine amidase [Bacillus sp. V3B]
MALILPWIGPISTTEASSPTISVAIDSLNVRSGPSLDDQVIATLKKGEEYPVIKEDGEWLQISISQEEKGWVANYLVTKNDTGITSVSSAKSKKTENETSPKTAITTVNSLNLRSEPTLNGTIINKLHKGTMVEVISEKNDWVKIHYAGQIGWVSGMYLQNTNTKEDNTKNEQTQTIVNSKISILHNGTNIRKNPNTQSSILDRANQGDTFKAILFQNDWVEIELSNGQTGYVASWLVSTQEANTEVSTTQVSNKRLDQYLQNKKIVIDPGHGGRDSGATGVSGTLEKKVTLDTASYLFNKLKAAGADVILTRHRDQYLSLPSRVNMASYHDADAFISIHYDSINNDSVRGLTTYYYYPWQKELAINIHSAVIGQTNMKDRGTRFGDYYVIRENSKKAILIELGYLSNPSEELHVTSDQYQQSAATGIYEGLARYFKDN